MSCWRYIASWPSRISTGLFEASLPAHSATAASNSSAGDDLVGEPVLDRLLGAQPLAQQHHLVDLLARDVAVDDRHDHVGEGADVDLRRAEGGPLFGDQQVAGEGEAHPARQHVAVGRAERGLAEARHQPEELEEEVGGEVFGDERHVGGEAAQVGAGAEDLVAGAGEDDRPRLLVVARPLHRVDQLGQHLPGEHVALLRVVQGHRGDPVGDLVLDDLVVHPGGTIAESGPALKVESATVHSASGDRATPSGPANGGETSGDRDDERLQSHQARPRGGPQALHLQPGARRPARVDAGLGQEGALAPPQRVGGHLLAHRGDEAGGRARLPRPLLPGGVRRPGRRLLLLAGPRRVHELLGLGRHQHGLRRADRHGAAADPPARHRGAEAALPRRRG